MAIQEFEKNIKTFGDVALGDFVAEDEITVTITLHEYRELVCKEATAQERIARANEDRFKRESENDSLRKENAELKQELYELKKENEALQPHMEVEDDGTDA